jgi:glycogen debranching enzyme
MKTNSTTGVTLDLPETFGIARTERLADPYITPGDRAFVIGTQDGAFPDLGWHVPGEMGGVWIPPLKLLDGFWLRVNGHWLATADEYASGSFVTKHTYTFEHDLRAVRTQFAPDGETGIVVRYEFTAGSEQTLHVRFLARSDLRSVWSPGEEPRKEVPDDAQYLTDLRAWLVTGEQYGGAVLVGAHDRAPLEYASGQDLWGPEQTRGNGVSCALDYSLKLSDQQSTILEFVICGGSGEAEARAGFERIRAESDALLEIKGTRYAELQASSRLQVTDRSIMRAWDWLKWNCDWLVCDVPGVGRGIAAGAQDYMWWFGCDSAYAVLGCLAFGQFETAVATLDLVRSRSERANGNTGRVLHECTTDGTVVHPGCTQETPHFTEAVWQVFCWTGNLQFLRRNYDFCKRGVLDWTLVQCCRDGELLPYGYGITETLGLDLQCIDSAVHTISALEALAEMAGVMDDPATAATCARQAAVARSQMEAAFWLEDEGLYADMLATPREMVGRIRAWISATEVTEFTHGRQVEVLDSLNQLLHMAESDPEPDRKHGWSLQYWMVITPLEAGLTPPKRAEQTLDRVRGPEFVGPHGMYLSGVDHTHTMSINTGALAVAELRYGRVGDALQRLRVMTDTLDLHMPGAISEMLPDYGCFVQAWSSFAVAWPVVAHMFGLEPRADLQTLVVNPQLPPDWGEASLVNVHVGDAHFDFHWDGTTMRVVCDRDTWSIRSSRVPLKVTSCAGAHSVEV